MARNGATTPDERDHLAQRLREDRAAAARVDRDARAGFMIPGRSPYADDWDLDLAWPAAEDVEDPIGASLKIAENCEVDARLVIGVPHKQTGRIRASTLKTVRIKSERDMVRLREATGWSAERMREYGPDPFAYGTNPSVLGGGGANAQYLPLWPGPVTRQLYWQDYWMMSAKAFEAYNHDPISWRCVHMKQEFALGKSLQARVTFSSANVSKAGQSHDKAQLVWDEFWKRNKMDNRLDMLARDLSVMGEQFLRFFPGTGAAARKLTIRSLDPASIYDLITDPEDQETVFAYHQQFQTPYQLYPPTASTPPGGVQAPEGPTQIGAATRYIIRQILPQEIDHYRTNSGAYERRGRSDLFPALGWIKRLRDYLTSHVIRADMLSRICWDLEVAGNQAAIRALRAALFPNGQAPPPGSVFGHTAASKLTTVTPQGGGGGSRWDPTMDALVTMVANSIGLPKDWLGFGMTTTRASALVATEPAARSLEELQGTLETILHDTFDRVMAQARITDAEIEITFPSIATEDRSQKLQDLSYAEANQYISKQTAATIAAKELGITTYDFDEEQALIAAEFEHASDEEPGEDGAPGKPTQGDGTIRRPMIVASNRQAPKLDPTKAVAGSEDEPPGLLVPFGGDAAATPSANGATGASGAENAPEGTANGSQPTRGGVPAKENPLSSAGASSIKTDLKAKESAVYTHEQVMDLLREARERRRRPDDPAFIEASGQYRRESAANMAELVRSAIPGESVREAASYLARELDDRAEVRQTEQRGWTRALRETFGRLQRPEVTVQSAVAAPDVYVQAKPADVHVTAPPAQVTVETRPPDINVTAEAKPPDVVVVNSPQPARKVSKRVVRDADGQITGLEEE